MNFQKFQQITQLHSTELIRIIVNVLVQETNETSAKSRQQNKYVATLLLFLTSQQYNMS